MSISLEIPKFHGGGKALLTEALSFSMDGFNGLTPSTLGRRESETKKGGDFYAVLLQDQNTVILAQKGFAGKPLDSVIVRYNAAVNNKPTVYLTITFKSVFISGVQYHTNDAAGASVSLTCSYGEKSVEFTK